MSEAVSVRLDDLAQNALRALESTGLSRSDAIRSALITAAEDLHRRRDLTAEAAALDADAEDRAEMASVAAMMESLRSRG